MNQRELSLAISPKRRDRVENVKWSWGQLIERLSTPVALDLTMAEYRALSTEEQLDVKNVGYFLACYCRDGQRRKANIEYRSAVCLDVDRGDVDVVDSLELGLSDLCRYEFFAHSTIKHTHEHPRLRVVLPLSRDVTPDEFEPVARLLAQQLDPTLDSVDHVTYRLAQVMFWPAVTADGEFLTLHNEGEWADPDALLASLPDWTDPIHWPQPHSRELPVNRNNTVAEDPREKTDTAPLVAAFCRTFSVSEAIDNWLNDKYAPVESTSERELRYQWLEGSGGAGARVYDDLFMYSDHDTDPAGGHSVNAFDLVRIHLFGEQDKGYEGPLTQSPSFKTMEVFCSELKPVMAELKRIQSEYVEGLFDDLSDEDDTDSDDPEIDDLLGEPAPSKALDTVVGEFAERARAAQSLAELTKVKQAIAKAPLNKLDASGRTILASVIQKATQALLGKEAKAPSVSEIKKDLWPDQESLLAKCESLEMPDWLKPWVYVTCDDEFFNWQTQEQISPRAFNVLYGDRCAELFGYDESGVGSIISASDAATFGFKIPCVYQPMYYPGRERIFEDQGITYVNSYRDSGCKKPASGEQRRRGVELMQMHLRNLFPDENHRAMLLDFMAHIVQRPEKKLLYAVLVAGAETDGKSWFIEMMRRVLGEPNCVTISTDALQEKFNGYIEGKLFCAVEEVKQHGRDARDVLNRMKAPISNETVPVRSMGRDSRTVRNFANWYMTTNFRDAMPVSMNESRYLILFTRFQTTEEVKAWSHAFREKHGYDFYTALYDEMRQHPWQFREFLERYTFSEHYDPNARAPETEFKSEMAELSKSEEEQLLERVLSDESYPALSESVFDWSRFAPLLDRECPKHNLRGRGVSSFMQRNGFFRVHVNFRHGDSFHRIWSKDRRFVDPRTGRIYGTGHPKKERINAQIRDLLDAQDAADEGRFENVLPFKRG